MVIVKDTAGQAYIVRDAGPALSHAYLGTPAKRGINGWEPKTKAKERLIRKLGTLIVATS